MKNKKINARSLMLAFACVSSCAAVVACSSKDDGSQKYNIVDGGDGYEWTYNQSFVDEMDADMKIDGKLDESVWGESGKKWLTHTEKNVDMRYTTAFTQKGLYIAAEAKDPQMQWNDTRSFANNSSFYFYIVSDKATEYHAFDCMGFYVDEKDSACRQNTRFAAKGSRTETSDGVPTLTVEFFASWKALNYTVNSETGMPDAVKFVPQYRYVESVDSLENSYLNPALAEVRSPRVKNAYRFDKDGYINVDVAGAELGNGDNGFAKSDGWDLSQIKGDADGNNKSVTSNTVGDQAIFFKNINSSRYSFSVDIEYKESLDTGFPAAGVCDMKDAKDFNIMRFHGNDITSSSANNYRYFLLDFHNGRRDRQLGNYSVTGDRKVIKLRVIKDDRRYYYIIGDKYEFSVDLDFMSGKTVPGLYTFDASVKFSNWQIADFEGSDKDREFAELCASYMHTVNVDTGISGGTVSVDSLAVDKDGGKTVDISIAPTRGYVLTDFTLNGKSIYDKVISEMKNGVYTVTPEGATSIGATFSAMPTASTLRLVGNVKRTGGAALIGLGYSVKSSQSANENVLYNYGSTTSAGIFDITLLKAGTYTIGGKTVTTDGKYTLVFDGIFPRGESGVVEIDTADDKYDGQSFFQYGDIVINPIKAFNMAENADGRIQTIHTSYESEEKFSYYIENDTVTGSFELDMTIDAHNDKWPCYGFTIEDENNNSMQLFSAGATTYRVMSGYDGVNYTQYDKNTTYKDGVSAIKLVYNADKDVFMFYVNGVLFDTIDRTDHLTGRTFKYGAVGYMSGADGSNTPVTADNPFATFTKPKLTREYVIDLPDGATATTDKGETVLDKVPVLSTVTVNIPVSDDKSYTVYVNGNPVETKSENGKLIATFDVTENCEITYAVSYRVGGKVTIGGSYPALAENEKLTDVEIYVVGANGKTIYKTNASANGEFTAILPDGEFYVGAKGKNLVSDAVKVTVADGVTGSAGLTLDKPAITEDLFENPLVYNALNGKYESVYGHGQKAAGYLAGAQVANGSPFAASVKMSDLGDDWPSGGFAIGNSADKFVKIEIVKADDGTYILRVKDEVSNAELLWWFRNIDEFKKYNSLDEFTMTVVYANGNYYIFLEGDLLVTLPETTKLGGTTIKASVGSGKTVKIGLYGEQVISFDGFGYTFAADDIKDLIGRTVTAADGITLTVNGKPLTDGALLGDVVTATMDVPSGVRYAITVDGNAIETTVENGKATATFTVTGDHDIAYSQTYAVGGSVTGGNADTVITVSNDVGAVVYTGKGETFATYLANGNYTVTAQNADKVSGGVKITVASGAVSGVTVVVDKPKLTETLKDFTDIPYDATTGKLTVSGSGKYNNGGYFGSVNGNAPFAITATVEKFDGAWWSAGFAVGTSASDYSRFVIRRRGDSAVYDIVAWHKTDIDQPALPDGIKDNPFTNEGDKMNIALVYNNGVYYLIVNGNIVHTVNQANGTGNINVGLFCEQNITYTDWGFTADVDTVREYLGRTITATDGVTLTTNGTPVADGKALLGDEVTATIAVADGQKVSILVDGKAVATTIDNGVASATFRVTGNHSVTYSVTYAVSGTTDANATVTFANADGSVAEQLTADASGNFSVDLPNGTYYLTARTETAISSAVQITVNNAEISGATVLATRPLITEKIFAEDFKINYKDGSLYSLHDGNGTNWYGGYLNGASVAKGNDFILNATIKGIGDSMWPSTGLLVGTSVSNYVRFNIIRNTNDNIFGLQIRSKTGKETIYWFNGAPYTKWAKPFGEDGTASFEIELVYHAGVYAVYLNDELAVTVNEQDALLSGDTTIASQLGDGNIKLGFYAERQITYTDWSYQTHDVEVPVEARLTGMSYDPSLGAFKSDWGNGHHTGVTDIDVKDVSEWAWSADVQIMSDWNFPAAGLALYNEDGSKEYIVKLLRNCGNPQNEDRNTHTWQFKFGDTDIAGDPNGSDAQKWIASNQEVLKGKVKLTLVHNANGYYVFVNDHLIHTIAADIVQGWGKVRLGLFGEQESAFGDLNYSTDISGYADKI